MSDTLRTFVAPRVFLPVMQLPEQRRQSNTWFAALAFGVAVTFCLVASIPIASRWIAQQYGVDVLKSIIGVESSWSARKLAFAERLGALCIALLVVLWAWTAPRRGRWTRLGVLAAAAGQVGVALLWLNSIPQRFEPGLTWEGLQRLRIIAATRLPNHKDHFAKANVLSPGVHSLAELHGRILERFSRDSALVASTWPTLDASELRAASMMNVVSGMWSYGNRGAPERAGCVGVNENTRFETRPVASLTVEQYLASRVGCCTDYATLLKYMLDLSGVPNRLVMLPGHVLVEAKLERGWASLDPTINVLYRAPWTRVNSTSLRHPVTAVQFPLAGSYLDDQWTGLRARFRVQMFANVSHAAVGAIGYQDGLSAGELPGNTLPVPVLAPHP